jgi:sortase B
LYGSIQYKYRTVFLKWGDDMDRNKIISIVLVVVFFVFIGLAVNEFYQYQKSNQTYEEAKEAYYNEKDISVELDQGNNTPVMVDDSEIVTAGNINTDADVATDTSTDTDEGAVITTDTTVVVDNGEVNNNIQTEIPLDTTNANSIVTEEEKETIAEAGSVIGWVSVPGTGIDYPVVQTKDNEYYLTHNYLGNKDVRGAIYMDYRNDEIGDDRNYVIYGHKMIDGSMFSDLVYYVQDGSYERYFNNYNTVKYDDYEEETEWKIFSAYVVDLNKEDYYLYTNYNDDEKYQEFIDGAYNRSLLDSDIEVTLDDEIMTLVTCSFWYKNSRVILHAVKQ